MQFNARSAIRSRDKDHASRSRRIAVCALRITLLDADERVLEVGRCLGPELEAVLVKVTE